MIKKREKNLSESAKVKNRSKNLYLEIFLIFKNITRKNKRAQENEKS